MRFFDTYSRFYGSTATLLKPNRFQQRWRMIIEKNADLLSGARVLDLASHDGRWAFASLEAGAAFVEGVEAREELVRRSIENFDFYGVDAARYAFICDDAVAYLRSERLASFDVALNLGFFYHTMRHMELLENMARTGAKIFIIDTAVSRSADAIIEVAAEPTSDWRNAVDHRNAGVATVPVGRVSRPALRLMLDAVGYDVEELAWSACVDDFSECEDYRAEDRGTFVARRR